MPVLVALHNSWTTPKLKLKKSKIHFYYYFYIACRQCNEDIYKFYNFLYKLSGTFWSISLGSMFQPQKWSLKLANFSVTVFKCKKFRIFKKIKNISDENAWCKKIIKFGFVLNFEGKEQKYYNVKNSYWANNSPTYVIPFEN